MNKEVIYIEPEDDITDVINRIKNTTQKVIALVPSKKMSIMRSAVNARLIAKSAKASEKVVVLVSADQSLLKTAASAGIPVAETLQSRPILPSEFKSSPIAQDDVIEVDSANDPDSNLEESALEEPKNSVSDKKSKKPQIDLPDLSSDAEKSKKSTQNAKSDQGQAEKSLPKFEKYRKFIIAGAIAFVALIGFLVWAIFVAPSVKMMVAIRTADNNFSEKVSLLTSGKDAPKSGKFLLTEYKHDDEANTEFDATGEKDVGNKAHGQIVAFAYFRGSGSISIPAGAIFNYNGLKFAANNSATINYQEGNKCENAGNEGADIAKNGCRRSVTVSATAIEAGDKYNVGAGHDWSSNLSGVKAYSDSGMSGGTSRIVKIVRQADVEKAKAQLETNKDQKKKLLSKVPKDVLAIDSSYKVTATDPVSSPAVGSEAPNGKAKLSAVTHYVIYGIDKSNIKKFIQNSTKSDIAEDQKIYSFGKPRFENFTESGGGFSAKLKTTYKTGPKVSDSEILEKSKGRKIGEVQSLIKSINGVSDVKVEPSFFWVRSVPNDPNRITIKIKVNGDE